MAQSLGKAQYKRVLIKLSGEALMGSHAFGIDPIVLDRIANDILHIQEMGVEIGLVVGGGNLFRGAALSAAGLGRVTGDNMGMLATVMNGLALRDALERAGLDVRVMSAIQLTGLVDPFDRRKAMYHLAQNRVVIFTAGTGNPFFTTDSAASLRAIEIEADLFLKATKVDGVYSEDPVKNPGAKKFQEITYDDVIKNDLGVMDLTAICLCRDNKMPLRVFNINKDNALKNIMLGFSEGTLVK